MSKNFENSIQEVICAFFLWFEKNIDTYREEIKKAANMFWSNRLVKARLKQDSCSSVVLGEGGNRKRF